MAVKAEPIQQQQQTFEQATMQAVQQSICDFLRKGEWIRFDYGQKIQFGAEFIRQIHSQVDMGKVLAIVKGQVEQKIADGMLNAMATEIATDVKSIMSNRELREDIRAVIRAKIREVESAVKT